MKDTITITLPKVQKGRVINFFNQSGKSIIVYNSDDLSFITISGIKNIFKMIYYNMIYFLRNKVKIKF